MSRLLRRCLALLLVLSLTACQGFVDLVTQAGDDGLVWPLPPTPARLVYDEEIDVNQAVSTYVGLATGSMQDIQLIRPYRVAAARDLLAIIDEDRGSAYVIDRFHNSAKALSYGNGTQLIAARDIAVDDMKRVYVLDSLKGQVAVFQDNGTLLNQFGSVLLWTKPDRLALDIIRRRLYVADSFEGRVYVFSLSGVFLYMFGEQGSGRGRFSGLADLTVDMEGNLYVLESTARRIQKFDPRGDWLQTIPLDKQGIREPVAIGVEKNAIIYIADRYQSQVKVLDKTGRLILNIGDLGRARGKFDELTDLDFDQYRQRLFTAETASSRVQVFRRTAEQWLPYP